MFRERKLNLYFITTAFINVTRTEKCGTRLSLVVSFSLDIVVLIQNVKCLRVEN